MVSKHSTVHFYVPDELLSDLNSSIKSSQTNQSAPFETLTIQKQSLKILAHPNSDAFYK